MDILDVCITGIVSEEELNRVVRVTIDTDCWGQTARVTGAFFKNDWERFKQRRSYPESKIISEESIPYFEGLSDDEFHTMKYGAKLSEFSDTEIAEEFNRRLDSPFYKIKLKGQAYIGK